MATSSATRQCARLALLMCLWVWPAGSEGTRISKDDDVILPYTKGHGPSHAHRHVRDYQFEAHGSKTYETWPASRHGGLPVAESTVFTADTPLSGGASRWVYGHVTVVRDPLRTLSVVEPGGPGGCETSPRPRVTVEETASRAGCLYAQNAGFFNTTSDRCLGNVVSDGRMVRDSGGVQNAQFGIRRDGSLVFGYLSQADVLDRSNPFVQLVSGVVWLLRNGEVYINQSLQAECNIVDMVFRNFVDVLSARTVVGHDADGNVVLFHVDGQTLRRGMNLWEVAEFLKSHGVINAINLDGGGSSSFVVNGTLASYPPDICKPDSRWRCARNVSTVLCVHERRCEPADCSGHGDCVNGGCRCRRGWRGAACDALACRPAACGPHGVCTADGCVCAAGWRGKRCSEECSPGFFGAGCRRACVCFNGAACHTGNGSCTCLPGFHGNFCEKVCPLGYYGLSCAHECQCDDHGPCDPLTGSCTSISAAAAVNRDAAGVVGSLSRLLGTPGPGVPSPIGWHLTCSMRSWLILTASLAALLLLRQLLLVMRASRRWILHGYLSVHVSLSARGHKELPLR
ncbi:N-acetylglucosamine-1-phosphodiester alpha-N-acetylglucosaminidase-like [Clinocottus analis]|uniref:N-acetylglucosamine-1-phosphodiester alpha-N-acetylglucosaminidase-like n=1 Tax=Clinocottus analis TaxID=304258 RepID=UPI0035C180FB